MKLLVLAWVILVDTAPTGASPVVNHRHTPSPLPAHLRPLRLEKAHCYAMVDDAIVWQVLTREAAGPRTSPP